MLAAHLRIPLLVVVASLCVFAPAGLAVADSVPLNVSLNPGDTLYVRFALTDMSSFPVPFNMFGTDYNFDAQYSNVSAQLKIYDDADAPLDALDFTGVTSLGLGPVFYDSSRGGSGGNVDVDLSSYDDGMGMASYRNTGGPTVLVETFDPRFGQKTQFGAWYPAMPYDYTYAVNALPPAVPEPATLSVLALGALALVRRRP